MCCDLPALEICNTLLQVRLCRDLKNGDLVALKASVRIGAKVSRANLT